jgi:glyoxylase-like metal-dependent hydrolase (beta-lactamase superfamily II)/8-oxo-dGTP pyrophosphatase MutT (NUDIX family)
MAMKESVSAVFVTNSKVYFIKRQNYLSVFPGYYSTPGGKVDKTDSNEPLKSSLFPKNINPQILHALIREVKEELNFDLEKEIDNKLVLSIDDIGVAITPEFNPYRFKNYYFKITISSEVEFDFDHNEVEFGEWNTPHALLKKYEMGHILAVPPAITLLRTFKDNLSHVAQINMSLPYNPEIEIPMIESLCGVRQFLPLSNTFPPANRTNSFIIGDENEHKILIDPSPKDESELLKFYKSIEKFGFNSIFLTHHHPDHYEFSNVIAKKYNVPIEMSEYTYRRIGEKYFAGIKIVLRKEGDIVTKSLGRDIYVYSVPGHDEGQLALAPKSMEWFLVGDLIQTIGTVAILAPEGNMQKYFDTLQRVLELNPKNIIPSHGIIVGGTNKIFETLNHRKMREEQIKDLLKKNCTIDEMIKFIYPDLQSGLISYAKRTIEAHLEKIQLEEK